MHIGYTIKSLYIRQWHTADAQKKDLKTVTEHLIFVSDDKTHDAGVVPKIVKLSI